ncbi:MAG TPA: hypothetical protein VFE47_09140 [Tepidisphaeraceae bacterium]|jgi:hypothetical protein|nr:hypothetical protein [Tepidisphaeraceae bacterium]
MSDLEQENFSPQHQAIVQDYLSATLDAQCGRAEARFRQFLAEQKAPPAVKPNAFPLTHRFRGWTLGIAGAALAASLAALWAGPSLKPVAPVTPNPGTPAINVMPVNNGFVQQDVQSQTFDDGTFLTDGDTPVRVLRRRDVHRTRWFDQNDKMQGEEVVPQDHVVYVPMKTY